mmetsp:Transcript_99835/g.279575  ORF Transcript_99835/g.279575 Transcript_99835/m.279575 type:complete len:453 (+) Transcript_99835:323-1681(+)
MAASPVECPRVQAVGPERRGHGPRELCRCVATRCSSFRTWALTLPARGASVGSGLWRFASASVATSMLGVRNQGLATGGGGLHAGIVEGVASAAGRAAGAGPIGDSGAGIAAPTARASGVLASAGRVLCTECSWGVRAAGGRSAAESSRRRICARAPSTSRRRRSRCFSAASSCDSFCINSLRNASTSSAEMRSWSRAAVERPSLALSTTTSARSSSTVRSAATRRSSSPRCARVAAASLASNSCDLRSASATKVSNLCCKAHRCWSCAAASCWARSRSWTNSARAAESCAAASANCSPSRARSPAASEACRCRCSLTCCSCCCSSVICCCCKRCGEGPWGVATARMSHKGLPTGASTTEPGRSAVHDDPPVLPPAASAPPTSRASRPPRAVHGSEGSSRRRGLRSRQYFGNHPVMSSSPILKPPAQPEASSSITCTSSPIRRFNSYSWVAT